MAFGKFELALSPRELQTLAFVTLVFGSQALLYVVRERRHVWSSKPSVWVVAASAADIGMVSLALSGVLMEPLSWRLLTTVFLATIGFALFLDQIKRPVMAVFKIK